MPSLAGISSALCVSLFVGEADGERPALSLSAGGAGANKTYEKLLFCRWGRASSYFLLGSSAGLT